MNKKAHRECTTVYGVNTYDRTRYKEEIEWWKQLRIKEQEMLLEFMKQGNTAREQGRQRNGSTGQRLGNMADKKLVIIICKDSR